MRFLSVVLCVFALVSFTRDVFGPSARGAIGMQVAPDNRVAAVQSGSPAGRAGLRTGDLIRYDRMPLMQRVAASRPVPAQPVTIAFERDGRLSDAVVVPESDAFWNANNTLAWALALLYAAIALLVAFRAARGRQRSLILAVLFGLSIGWALDAINALPDPAARLAARAIMDAGIVVFLIAAYVFVLSFPQRTTRASKWLWNVGLPVTVASALLYAADSTGLSLLHVFPVGIRLAGDVFTLFASLAMAAGVVDGIRAASVDVRRASIVAGSTLMILALVNFSFACADLSHFSAPWLDYVAALQWASGFGVSYAVLRHRLLDLNLVISRAAIFSVVSLLLLGVFALSEWVFATLLERSLGSAFNEGGKTALAAFVALLLGLSAGTVHRVVEHRLNRVFFAKRYRALEDLHRFALETDAVLDSSALLELTLNTLRRDLDVQYVALYTGTPERGYVAVGTTAAPNVPLRLDQNEETVLRLRRWGEAFVVENEEHPLRGAFVSPMILRGTLYGFAICGPKDDRTSYLRDEQDAVAELIHRVGIAFEWLTRSGSTSIV